MTDYPCGLYLSFDYGERHIGIACGHSEQGTANPLRTVDNRSGTPDWESIGLLVSQWQPVGLIVGVPLHMDGNEQPLTAHARGFGKGLAKRYKIPVYETDERLSTREASGIIRDNRKRGKRHKTNKADLDKIAAALILEKWFGSRNEFDK